MSSMENTVLLQDLNADEAAALNGGYYCYRACAWRYVRVGWRYFYRWVCYTICR